MANKIQLRRDTAANWSRINPILADGEPGLDITNNKIKLGDGTTAWNSLTYLSSQEHTRLVNGSKVVTLQTDGKLILSNGSSEIYADPIDRSVRIGTSDTNVAPNNQIKIGGTHAFEIFGGPPGYSWKFDTTGYTTFPGGAFIGRDTVSTTPAFNGTMIGAALGDDFNIQTTSGLWKFGADGKLTLPTNGIVTAKPGYTGASFNIVNIVQADPVYPVVITTSVAHGLSSGTKIRITGITTSVELNDKNYYVTTPASNMLELYSDPNCTVPVFGSTNTPYFVAGNRPTTISGYGLAGNNPGFTDRSMQFFNGYVDIEPSLDFNIGTGDFSVSFWVSQDNYVNNPRLFSFGTWGQFNPLAVSSESGALYFWLNGNIYGYGLPSGAMSLNTWHHLVITRFNGVIYLALDGTVYNHWANTDDIPSGVAHLSVANQGAHDGGLYGYMRDFKINVGQGIDLSSLSYTVPSTKATVDPGYTKLLLIDYPSDSSMSGTVPGGGSAVAEYRGADLTIALTSPSPGLVDTGDIVLTNNTATWKFSETGKITFPDNSTQTGASISISEIKTLAAASTDFADFKSRIAGL